MFNLTRLTGTARNDSVVSLLRARLAAEQADAAEADRRAAETALAAVDGDVDAKTADKAHAAAVEAQRRRELTERTLAAALVRADEQERTAAKSALADQFKLAVSKAEAVAKCAERTEAASAAYVEAVHAQQSATADLYGALPAQLPWSMRDGLWLENDDLQGQCKRNFEHLRLWGPIEPLHPFQPFALKYRQAVGLLAERAASILAKMP